MNFIGLKVFNLTRKVSSIASKTGGGLYSYLFCLVFIQHNSKQTGVKWECFLCKN